MNPLSPKQILHGFEIPNSGTLAVGLVSKTLTVSEQAVHNLIHAGELEATNIAAPSKRKAWRVSRANLIDFIDRRTTGPEGDFQASEAPRGLDLPPGKILRIPAASRFLRCSQQHIADLIRAGQIRATNVGRYAEARASFRIARSSLVRFINSRTMGGV